MDIGTHSYIGISSCGCVRALVHDMPGYATTTARDVASFIKSGMAVERLANDDAARRFGAIPSCERHWKNKDEPKAVMAVQGSLL